MRTRVRLGLFLAGFAILLVEVASALYCSVRIYLQMRGTFTVESTRLLVKAHLPAALLALATILAAVVVWQAVRLGVQRRACIAVLAPLAALLVGYSPSLAPEGLFHLSYAGVPWAAPIWWGIHGDPRVLAVPFLVGIAATMGIYCAAIVVGIRRRGGNRQIDGAGKRAGTAVR